MNIADFDLKKMEIFVMILVRTCGLFSLLPIFGSKIVNAKLRYGFCLIFTFVLYPIVLPVVRVVEVNSAILFLLFVLKEFFIGIILSFISTIIFTAVRFGGEQIGRQMGMGMARIFDPTSDSQTNVIVQFQYFMAILIFLSLDAHHLLIIAVKKSFELIPLGGFIYTEFINNKISEFVSYIFIYGIKISAPVLVMVIIATVALGIMAKTAPEMNILMIGFPLKIFMGLMGLSLAIPLFSYILRGFFIKMNTDIFLIMQSVNLQY